MKKILTFLLSLLFLIFAFCGCIDFKKDHTRFKGKLIERNNASLEDVKLIFVSQREEFLKTSTIRRDNFEKVFDNTF